MFSIRINGCRRTAIIETLMRAMGAEEVVDATEILFDAQLNFNSNIYHHDLKLPVHKNVGWFRNWIYVTFKYNRDIDMGYIEFSGSNRHAIEDLMNELQILQNQADDMIENSVLKKEKSNIDNLLKVQSEEA